MASRYRQAFQRRVRQIVKVPGIEPFKVWCARPEDVIVGKLMAWDKGRSRKHETDIYEMMVFHYLGVELTKTRESATIRSGMLSASLLTSE